MATTLEIAKDEILKRFTEQWNLASPAIIGGSPLRPGRVEYVDYTNWTGRPKPPDDNKENRAWARITVTHATGFQATLRGEGELFTNEGTVIVQIFSNYEDSAGSTIAERLAGVAKRAFMGRRTPNVWFSNPRYQEIGREGIWYQINVSADFQWDERR